MRTPGGWKEYRRPELPGKRHRVAVTTTGCFGTLICADGADGDELKLVTEGAVFCSEDELRGSKLEVGIAEPQKLGTDRAGETLERGGAADVGDCRCCRFGL